ncbi:MULTISPECIES: hypothetical protein [Mycetohabitans]|uniref:hypothetical protein n=1 Tax=Mycetohabitans TaxID=2571159 RepID=UPI001F32C741|nr:hypothetical protein [Mycetohabitans sp. B3]MCF2134593.1 hypothetical protein [Mycetohabitans sp. B3]
MQEQMRLNREAKKNHKTKSLGEDHADMRPEVTLSQISMLGAHDAGTHWFSRKKAEGIDSLGTLFPGGFKCQSLSLVEQARAGVRYFDIRVKKGRAGKFSFFHGPSKTGGDALAEVMDLFNYAVNDKDNLYIFKMHFDKRDAEDFLCGFVNEYIGHLIYDCAGGNSGTEDSGGEEGDNEKEGDNIKEGDNGERGKEGNNGKGEKPLGSFTVGETLGCGKNILIMVNHAEKSFNDSIVSKYVWDYKGSTYSKWADKASGKKTAKHILKFHGKPEFEDKKISIIQSNMPLRILPVPKSVKNLARDDHNKVIKAINEIYETKKRLGIVSIDYAGKENISSTNKIKNLIRMANEPLMKTACSQLEGSAG